MLYRERLWVPLSWCLIGALLTSSVLVAVGAYLGPAWGLATGLLSAAGIAAIFAAASVAIRLDSRELVVGRARIELTYLSGAVPLDKVAAERRTGTDADARAFLVVRPYVPGAVEITLNDPEDPVPYWLVSSRDPERFASALSGAISATGGLH